MPSLETINELRTIMIALDKDYDKFKTKYNKTACTRCRKHVLDISKLTGKLRKQLLEERKTMVKPPKVEKPKSNRPRGRPKGSKSKPKPIPKESDE